MANIFKYYSTVQDGNKGYLLLKIKNLQRPFVYILLEFVMVKCYQFLMCNM